MSDGQGPELLGLCEVENEAIVRRLVGRLNGNFRVAHVESPDIRGIDTSLVYSPDRFRIAPEAALKAHLVHLRFPTRDIFEVPMSVKESGEELIVIVNHWPSRVKGRYESEPYRIAVANHCAHIVRRHLKIPRAELLKLQDREDSLKLLNERWNRNVLIMGDLNDQPYDRSVLRELQASGGLDRIEEPIKQEDLKSSYLKLRPTLFNCMWKFLGEQDEGTYYYSKDVNTMNILDHFIISRGLLFGEAGLKFRPDSVSIFKPKCMISSKKRRPRRFKYDKKDFQKPASGTSDHFPITAIIETVQ